LTIRVKILIFQVINFRISVFTEIFLVHIFILNR
jgi:hypothetical protein